MYTNKELRKAQRAIEETAIKVGETSRQFRLELKKAMDAARKSKDPAVRAEWATFEYAGAEPTPEEFVAWSVRKVVMLQYKKAE